MSKAWESLKTQECEQSLVLQLPESTAFMWRQINAKLAAAGVSRWLLVGLALLPATTPAASWLTDLPTAQAAAKAENKLLLINFTGSDWCGWCIRLRNEVFSQPEFEAFANANLVLMEADFPHHKSQSAAVKEANGALASQFQITGFPTLIVLDSDGQKIGKLGYQPGGPQAFAAALTRLSGSKTLAPPAPAPKSIPKDAPPPAPLFNGALPSPPKKFEELILKGISGAKNHRLAMITNKTFSPGESAVLTIGNGQVKLKCLEVREDSVLVSLDGGEQKELRMGGGL